MTTWKKMKQQPSTWVGLISMVLGLGLILGTENLLFSLLFHLGYALVLWNFLTLRASGSQLASWKQTLSRVLLVIGCVLSLAFDLILFLDRTSSIRNLGFLPAAAFTLSWLVVLWNDSPFAS